MKTLMETSMNAGNFLREKTQLPSTIIKISIPSLSEKNIHRLCNKIFSFEHDIVESTKIQLPLKLRNLIEIKYGNGMRESDLSHANIVCTINSHKFPVMGGSAIVGKTGGSGFESQAMHGCLCAVLSLTLWSSLLRDDVLSKYVRNKTHWSK